MRLALAQMNPVIGDIKGNCQRLLHFAHQGLAEGASLIIAPELAITGYPPRDLLLDRGVLKAAWQAVQDLAGELPLDLACLLGVPIESQTGSGGLNNAAVLILDKEVQAVFTKTLLPNHDVFDEARYFVPGPGPGHFDLGGLKFGVSICEDAWNDKVFWKQRRYPRDPVQELMDQGIDLLLNLSASPFSLGKHQVRRRMFSYLAASYQRPICLVNQVGGNDDLIFPGRSLVLDPRGRVVKQGPSFAEGLIVFDTEDRQESLEVEESPKPAEAFNAVVLGTRDYVYKTGFSKVLLGLSGGVDSALCAVVAVEALGQENVLPVLLPSAYTSRESLEDAQALIQNLGLNYEVLAIDGLLAGYESVLSPVFADSKQDVTEENIQARVRGDLLMAMANKFGALLLATGNKSELAVGYCTLYGDMCGALGVIADMPKTLVYEVCQWLNSELGGLIPERILHKPPSAELRPGQKDTDNLPDYQILDAILDLLIDKHYSSQQCVEAGHAPDLVRMVHDLVCRAEFKRRQAPPGLKITDRAFGTGWRMPLAASWPGDL